jgi:hypothetical protein
VLVRGPLSLRTRCCRCQMLLSRTRVHDIYVCSLRNKLVPYRFHAFSFPN